MDVGFGFNSSDFDFHIDTSDMGDILNSIPMQEPLNQPEQKLSMIPIFGFEMYAPPLVPEMETMSAHEIIELMRRTSSEGIANEDYVNCAKKIIQISVWFADHFDKLIDNKIKALRSNKLANKLAKKLAKKLARKLYEMNIDAIKKSVTNFTFLPSENYEKKSSGSEQFGLAHLGLFLNKELAPIEIEWCYKNKYFEKRILRAIRGSFINKTTNKLISEINRSFGNQILSDVRVFQLHLVLKFLAPYYGVDPDKEKIRGLYGFYERIAINTERSFQQRNFKLLNQKVKVGVLFAPDKSTDIYGRVWRKFNPDYKREKAPKVKPLPSWTYKPWNELTTLQKKYICECYQNPAGMTFEKNEPGAYRMLYDYDAYWKLHDVSEQFRPFMTKQWQHLLKNPELMDGLHAWEGNQDCPLILVRQARHHVWMHCYTAHMTHGIVRNMTQTEFPHARALFGRELNGEVSAEDLKLLMNKIKDEKIKCLVITESVVMSPSKMPSSSSSDNVTGVTKKKIKKKRKLKPVEEPEMDMRQTVEESRVGVKTKGENYSVTSELLHDAFAFNTGDFLLDSALEELAKAQSALSVVQLKLGNELGGNTWPESELKMKLGGLPLEWEKHKPILHHKLKPYQNDAINHCRHLHKHGLSGLLAADAGLGKTLICLNMIFHEIAYNPYNESPILVLCPKSLLHQWEKAFWKEFDEAKQFIEQKLRDIPQQIWTEKLVQTEWKSDIMSSENQFTIQQHLNQINANFYPNLIKFLYLLGYSCGQEGRDALLKLLKGFPHDIRLVFLASLSGNLVGMAENCKDLEHVLNRKPRVVIATVSSLVKMNKVEQRSFSWVVIDEADRAITGKKEKKLGEILNGWKNQNRLLVTATPVRNSISDVWKLLELVNGTDKNGKEFFNQLLMVKEEFMRQLLDVANDVEVDMEEMVYLVSKLHQRVRYLRENIHPLTFTARRDDPEIRSQWNGMIPQVNRRTLNIQLNARQQQLLATTLKVNNLFTCYDNETKVKQHPDLIESGTSKLVESNSIAFSQLVLQAKKNPVQVIEGSPMWKEMMQDLQGRVQQNQKCLIVCRHIVPQMILKEVIGSFFARYNILVDYINGDMNATMQGSALDRYKMESQRPAVLLLINKSGGAGLDFPDAKVMYVLGEEWNDGSREQIESRHVRVGVGGEKEIIYYHAGLRHEKHMRDTSMKKKLWGDLIISHPPSRETFLEDIEMMLKASVVELCAPVKEGKQLDEEQRGRLEAFSTALVEKVKEYETEIYDAYDKCRPKEAARPSSPKKIKVSQAHPYLVEGKDNVRCIEIPLRDSQENAWRYAYMNLERMIDCAEFIQANKEQKVVSCAPLHDRLKRHEKEKFDTQRFRVVLYYPDGSSQVLHEKPGTWTVRLLALPDGTFSPLVKL